MTPVYWIQTRVHSLREHLMIALPGPILIEAADFDILPPGRIVAEPQRFWHGQKSGLVVIKG
jgi:hypothetical protein